MNILNIEHVNKIYGEKIIFDDVCCGIDSKDKIGIIGINGTGKTTLLKIIAGIEEADSGDIIKQNGIKIGYLPQSQVYPKDTKVLDYVIKGCKLDEWTATSEAKSILNTLGLTDHEQLVEHLSGGQKKRASLARVLLEDTDMLILDEPTNHLDGEMLKWLENFLNKYKGAILMVTHDRYFLDKVTNRILELDHGKIYSYDSDYSGFLELKAEREEMLLASDRKRKSMLRMELEWAKRGCRARSTKQRARLERLEALKAGKTPVADAKVELESIETRMGKKTIEFHHVSKAYEDKELIKDFDYIVLKNQRLGIIGPNGCGKSTLIKMLNGIVEPDAGYIEIGETVRLGYFAQEVPDMDDSRRVIDYVKDIAEYIPVAGGRITASQMLERFLFTPEMQYAPIAKLSGGEKKRLYLLGILQTAPNCLIIDECNDLDIPTLTILEDYLSTFPGIVITVSHDRYFLDNVVDRIFAFEDGVLHQYEGGYTDYLNSQNRPIKDGEVRQKKVSGTKEESVKSWKKNAPVKIKFTYKEEKEYETIDETIASLEEKIENLDAQMIKNATNSVKLSELMEEKERAEKDLEYKMDRWVYLNDLAEKIEAQKKK